MEEFYIPADKAPEWLIKIYGQIMEETGKSPEDLERDAQRFRAADAMDSLTEIRSGLEDRADLMFLLKYMVVAERDTHKDAQKVSDLEDLDYEREPWERIILEGIEDMIRRLYIESTYPASHPSGDTGDPES